MWMVSRLIVIPFQPRRMAPFGLPHAFFRPSLTFCTSVGVMVGSLKMAPMRDPAATASWSTWSSLSSRATQERS
jgi:hypothetical protein